MPRRRLKNREATDENPLPGPLSLCGHGEAGPNVHARATSATPLHTGPGTREGLGFPRRIRGA